MRITYIGKIHEPGALSDLGLILEHITISNEIWIRNLSIIDITLPQGDFFQDIRNHLNPISIKCEEIKWGNLRN